MHRHPGQQGCLPVFHPEAPCQVLPVSFSPSRGGDEGHEDRAGPMRTCPCRCGGQCPAGPRPRSSARGASACPAPALVLRVRVRVRVKITMRIGWESQLGTRERVRCVLQALVHAHQLATHQLVYRPLLHHTTGMVNGGGQFPVVRILRWLTVGAGGRE